MDCKKWTIDLNQGKRGSEETVKRGKILKILTLEKNQKILTTLQTTIITVTSVFEEKKCEGETERERGRETEGERKRNRGRERKERKP